MSTGWAEEYYGLFGEAYSPGTGAAKKRLAADLPQLLRHLPRKDGKVLDLCCGGGIYLFELEKSGCIMTGVDIEERLVRRAREYAKRIGSKSSIVSCDASNLRFKDESFDAVLFLGSALTHFGIEEYRKIAGEAFRVLGKGGVMLSVYMDFVKIFGDRYQRVLYEPSEETDVISIHTKLDTEKGTFNRLFLDLGSGKRFKGEFFIWAPYIFRHVMEDVGFVLRATEATSFGPSAVLDVHEKPKRPKKGSTG